MRKVFNIKKAFIFIFSAILLHVTYFSWVDGSYAQSSRGVEKAQLLNVEFKGGLFSIHAEEIPLGEVLAEIEKQSGFVILIEESLKSRPVTLSFSSLNIIRTLESITNAAGLGGYGISYKSGDTPGRIGQWVVNKIALADKGGESTTQQKIIPPDNQQVEKKTIKAPAATKKSKIIEKEPFFDKRLNRYVEVAKGEVFVRFPKGATKEQIEKFHKEKGTQTLKGYEKINAVRLKIPATETVQEFIEKHSIDPNQAYVEPVFLVSQQAIQVNDPSFMHQWAIPQIHADKAWEINNGSPDVIVAVIDTGIDVIHPDLKNKVVQGVDIVNGGSNGIDDNGHGTHVAGIIAAESNNSIGIAGISWKSKLMPVKVITSTGEGTYSDLIEGIIYAADHGARVLNLSLGGYSYSQSLADAIEYAHSNKAIIVAAGGNEKTNEPIYPAAYPNVISVSATDSSDQIWPSSNYGSYIKISAPGVNVLSTQKNNSYSEATGTSVSTAHVSGVGALILSKNPDFSNTQVENILYQTADDLGDKGLDSYYGFGRVNALKAIEKASIEVHDVAVTGIRIEPETFKVGEATKIIVTVENQGTFVERNLAVKVSVNGEIVGDTRIIQELYPEEKVEVSVSWLPDTVGQANIIAEAALLKDDDISDNSLTREANYYEKDGIAIIKFAVKTHRWITEQAVRFLEGKVDTAITNELNAYLSYLKDGAEHEDCAWYNVPLLIYSTTGLPIPNPQYSSVCANNPIDDDYRYMRHFFRPLDQLGYYDSPTRYDNALKWGGIYGNDIKNSYDWADALAAYGADVNSKNAAYFALGHVLHLLEDLSLPEHTHLEAHVDAYILATDGYEEYVRKQTQSDTVANLPTPPSNAVIVQFGTLEDYFKNMAKRSYFRNRFKGTLSPSPTDGTQGAGRLKEMFPSLKYKSGWVPYDGWRIENDGTNTDLYDDGLSDWEDIKLWLPPYNSMDVPSDEWWETSKFFDGEKYDPDDVDYYYIEESHGVAPKFDKGSAVGGSWYPDNPVNDDYKEVPENTNASRNGGGKGKSLAMLMAEDLVPEAIRHVAGAIMLFWNETHLSVTLSANPSTGTAPLTTNLTATVSGGTATDTINYTLWWNCNDSGTSVSAVMGTCGSIPTPSWGSCASNSNGIKCDGVTDNPKIVTNTYSAADTYTAKVIAERGSAPPAESRTTITVSASGTTPTATTSTTSTVTSTSATLNGSVNPNGSSTTAWFEWGTSPTLSTYNSTSPSSPFNSLSTVQATLSGLSPSTTYYYRAAASNSGGTSRGTILNFSTSPSSTTQTELITNGSFETVGLAWDLQTNGLNQTDSWWNINNPSGAYSGSRYEYLGAQQDGVSAANNVNGLLYQTVTILAGTTATLSYYMRITTNESPNAAYDRLYVEIQNTNGGVLSTANSYSNLSSTSYSSWTLQTVNLSSYAGQTIRIAFHGVTDGATMTVFRIDDVSIIANTSSAVPTVTTSNATAISSSSATLNGSVNPNGSTTTAWFEWGTSSTLSSYTQTSNQSIGSGTTSQTVSSNLSGLNPSTTYYYRIAASNSAGTSRETILNFSTQAIPITTRTLSVASSNPSSGVYITVSPNDNYGYGSGSTLFTRTYNNGTSVTLTAPSTAGGNNFQKWQRNGVDYSTNSSTSVTMDANYTMTAVYVTPTVQYQLTTSVSPSGAGNISPNCSGGCSYSNGTAVALTATANSGYAFSSWSGCDSTSGTTCYVTMNSNKAVAAYFVYNGVINTTPTIITGGIFHTIFRKSDGTVWTWGDNSSGQLGDGTTTNRYTPVQVGGLSGITSVAGGYYHASILKNDGAVWGWGGNQWGQLGDGTTTGRATPVQTSGLSGVVALDDGNYHALALKSDGTVWTWGYNSSGQLGDGTTTNRSTPVYVSGLAGVTAITGGGEHSIALKNDGTVWAWGNNTYGQLGDGTTTNRSTPFQVGNLSGVIAITAGWWHSVALKSDGTVWAWGSNTYGQLGDGTTTNRSAPVQVSGLSGITAIASWGSHTLALKSDGTVWAWGYNGWGQLGDGTTTNRYTPVQVSGLTNVVAIGSGGYHSVAKKSDETIWAWGYNNNGQLGDGTTTDRYTPVQVQVDGVIADTTPPTIVSTSPPSNTTGVFVNAPISATFSESMDASTITASTFTLKQGSTSIPGNVSYSGTTATLTPSNSLAYNTTYTATITSGVKDAAGNAIASNNNWSFTTASETASTYPSLSSPVTVASDGGQIPIIKKWGNNVYILNGDVIRNLMFYKSADNGMSFASTALANPVLNSYEYEFSMDMNGYLYAFWESSNDSQLYIRKSLDGGTTWSSPTTVASGFTWIDNPSVIFSNGTLYLLFRGYKNSKIELYLIKSTDNGSTFSAPVQATNNSIQENNGKIAVYGSNVYVVYYDNYSVSPGNIYLVASLNGGSSFGAPVQVNRTSGKSDFGLSMGVDGSGNIFVAYKDTTSDYGDLYVAKSTNGGSSFTYTLGTDSTYRGQEYPKIFIDGNNYVHLLWNDNRDNVSYGSVYYTRSNNGGASYEANVNIRNAGGISNGSLFVDSDVVYIAVTDYTTSPFSTIFYKLTWLSDATAPTTTASPAGGTYNTTQNVTLTCSDGTSSGCGNIYYTTDGTTPTTLSTVYSTPITVSSTTTLKFFAVDATGNIETVKTETYTINIDIIPPTGTITINSGASYAASTSVTLALSASDSSGVSQMCISNTDACSSWETYATSKAWTLTTGDGAKTVYAWFKDSIGNPNTSPYSASIVLDTTAPSDGNLSATAENSQITLTWSGFSDATSGIASYKLVYSTSSVPAFCAEGTALPITGNSYTHRGLTNGTTYYYRFCAIDNAGNPSFGTTAYATPVAPDGVSIPPSDTGITGVEREDGGSDNNNIDSTTNKPRIDITYNFGIVIKDPSGNQPQYARFYMTNRSNPAASDFYSIDLTCTGSWAYGATCNYATLLGPAANHKYYFEAKLADGSILRYPLTGEISGPVVELLSSYNMVSIPRDTNGANMDSSTAFGNTQTYKWVSTGLTGSANKGSYVLVDSNNPVKPGEGYFTMKGDGITTLPEHGTYADTLSPTYEITLKPGWNMVSNPYGGNVMLSAVQVQKGSGAAVSWTDATASGYVVNAIYYYKGSDWGSAYTFESAGGSPDAILVPWFGYWVYLNKNDDTYKLVITRP